MQHKLKLSFFGLILSILLSSCALFKQRTALPKEIARDSTRNRVTLKSIGRVLVMQKVKRGKKCTDALKRFDVQMKSGFSSSKLTVSKSCKFKPGFVTAFSRYYLKKGKYTVDVQLKRKLFFSGDPILSAQYKNPNFESGDDVVIAGSLPFESGKLDGDVSYTDGDASDWIQLKGERSAVRLTLVATGKDDHVKAMVYTRARGGKKPVRIGRINPGEAKTFRLHKDNLFVKILDDNYTGPSTYQLVREDSAIVRRVSIPVMDYYPIAPDTSIVLLQTVQGLKKQDEVVVYGKENSGKIRRIGRCFVASIRGQQASCRMSSAPKPDKYVEYQAKISLEG